jgi:hypothetical protein
MAIGKLKIKPQGSKIKHGSIHKLNAIKSAMNPV